MSEKPQFDALIGGKEHIPSRLDMELFTTARAKEIVLMKNSLSAQSGTKLAFQKLPKHMRRRVMSHNVKRLPRRLREIHLNQMKKSGMPPKNKKPSRKYRRRPRNLTDEYFRRQQRCKWLKTHIWHAKRFHMVEKWGYKLPNSPCDKAFRACYRASAQHCLVQDISYFRCLELQGPKSAIVDNFKLVTNRKAGYGIDAKAFVNGNREGTIVLYNLLKKPIGPVHFLWRNHETSPKLWLWCHTAFETEIISTLINLFNLGEVVEKAGKQSYKNNDITLGLNSDLSRFRLTGPLSNAILQDAFKLASNHTFLNEFIENNAESYKSQTQYWLSLQNLKAVSHISPHLILSVIVKDPRFNFPKKRAKSVPENEPCVNIPLPTKISNSPLWEENYRDAVKANKITNARIAELRSNLLVPGSDLEEHVAPVPVILVQRPGNKQDNCGFGSGWDLIVHSEWAQPFWLALIMRGGRSGGLRETGSMEFEMGRPDFLSPDTQAGSEEEKAISEDCKEKYFRQPPNKRTSFNKLAIASPFCWNWRLLIQEWSKEAVDDFSVVREKRVLEQIQDFLNSRTDTLPSHSKNSLVPVRLSLSKKGSPKQFSVICLPKPEDFKEEPKEPKRGDKNQKARNEVRKSHASLLKKLRRHRIKAKKKGEKIPIDREMLKTYTEKMRDLWLPAPTSLRDSCSREVVGLVKKGGFSFAVGKAVAIGYVAMGALAEFINLKSRNKVLVRNTNSRQYRLAMLNVIFE